jgi:hypothetical protein
MLTLKSKPFSLVIFLLIGLGYFGAVSGLHLSEFWKSEIALIPVQLGMVMYFTYLQFSNR